MSRCWLSGLRLLLGSLVVVTASTSAAFAACTAPAQSGMALCFPSVNSTVLFPATIEMGVNSGGVPLTHMSVYDGNVRVDDFNYVSERLIDYGMGNGFHRITVNVWDANGKLYQAKTSFTITGFGRIGPCTSRGGAITLCTPSQGSYAPEDSLGITANFAADVMSWSISIDGKPSISSVIFGATASGPLDLVTGAAAGNHAMFVSAVDSKGVTSTVTRKFSTFYHYNCGPKSNTCSPGIVITQPTDISEGSAGDEAASFRLQAEVVGNPKPITKMIVYMDGMKKQQSTGPGIAADLGGTPGSHFIVVSAWDTTGDMYETYGNVNLQ